MLGFVALNLVMYACFTQSTSVSIPNTKKKGERTCPTQSGSRVKECGRREEVDSRVLLLGDGEKPEGSSSVPPVSTRLRAAMMMSMSQSWKRSTTSAQVIWKRFSFSIFLKTVDLISTNWLDMRSVRRALE